MPFVVACAQLAPIKAEVDANLDRIAEALRQAAREGAELVAFSETATTGYFLEGGVLEASLTAPELAERLAQRLGDLARPVDAVIGFYERAGGNLYNSAAYLEFAPDSATVRGVYRKFFLPTYGVFDEERFVSRGRDLLVLDTRLGRIGVLICEDVWHGVLPMLCAVHGAQLLVVPSASPGRGFGGPDIENHDRYERLFRAISEEHGLFCVNTQLVGFEGGKGFIGGSMITDPMGRLIAEAPKAEEALLLAEVDPDLVGVARAQSPLLSDLMSAWSDVQRLVAGAQRLEEN